jgi:uncharacterized protein YfeS
MKFAIITFLASALAFSCTNGQTKNKAVPASQKNAAMDKFEFTFKSAHPNARALMKEEFYWSPIEETAPFGNDDGADASYGFVPWRTANKTESCLHYLEGLIQSWQYPYFDYREMDTTRIKEYITRKQPLDEASIQQQIQLLKEYDKNSPDTAIKLDDKQLRELVISSSESLGDRYLLGIDNAIIATGFAQFVFEGHIDKDIKSLTITAIDRQLLPLLINRYSEDFREKRKEQLSKMLDVINKAN